VKIWREFDKSFPPKIFFLAKFGISHFSIKFSWFIEYFSIFF
jgi:hypothetical protein